METKIQLTHPSGKKAVSMAQGKYESVKKPLLDFRKTKGEATHSEILRAITSDFKKHKTKFQGSVEWHMEWVKLDLEANKIIERVKGKVGTKFRVKK